VTKGELISEVEDQIKMVAQICEYLNEILDGDYLVVADVMDAVAYNDLRVDFTKIITFDKAEVSLSSLAYMATVNPVWFEDAKTR
jgi:hypothetical protein